MIVWSYSHTPFYNPITLHPIIMKMNYAPSSYGFLRKLAISLGFKSRDSIIRNVLVFFLLLTSTGLFAQSVDQRAEDVQNATFNIYMSADQSYFKANSASDNNPYGYGYWVAAHGLETLADAYQRTRNVVYYNRMKSIIAGIRKYNNYGAGTYHNDYYDDLEWLCLALVSIVTTLPKMWSS